MNVIYSKQIESVGVACFNTCRTFTAGRNLGNLEIEGEILINGENAGTSMSKVSAYVQVKTVFRASYTTASIITDIIFLHYRVPLKGL